MIFLVALVLIVLFAVLCDVRYSIGFEEGRRHERELSRKIRAEQVRHMQLQLGGGRERE